MIKTMKKLSILFIICIVLMAVGDAYAQRSKRSKRRTRQKTHKVVRSKKKKSSKKTYVVKPAPIVNLQDSDYNPYLMCEDTCGHVHGIDLSHYQGEVFWETVGENTKMAYVYLKATEGTGNVDDTYRYNFNECKRVGLKVGSYHFFRPQLSARGQFDNFMSRVETRRQDLLPVVDIETTNGVSDAVLQSRLLEFCELLEKEFGKKPIIYTGKNFYNKHIHGNSRLRAYKFFIAAYSFIEPDLYDDNDYVLWQYSATGSVRGIRGNVDMSRFVGRHDIRDIQYR